MGEFAQRWRESSFHHQEISQRRVFIAARRRDRQGRRCDRQGALRHLFPARGETWTDAADRGWVGHVAALVHPGPITSKAGNSGRCGFFYGARTRADLFYLDELSAIGSQLKDFKFIPALSHAADGDDWTVKPDSFMRSYCPSA